MANTNPYVSGLPSTSASIAPKIRQDRTTAAIANAATRTGVDFSYLYHQARIESGLDPDAKARTSSATGLYQFINQSWLGVVDKHGAEYGLGWAANAIEHGANGRYYVRDPHMRQTILDLRKNPETAAVMAGEFAADNRAYIEGRTGKTAAPVDLYLAHFLGPAGAAKFLGARDDAPGQSAAALFPNAAAANRSIFYAKNGAPRSLDGVRALFAAKLGVGAQTPLPANATGGANPRLDDPAMPDNTPSVLPSDYLRIASQNGASGTAHAPTQSALIAPAEARLAYLMFASMGVSA